MRKVEANCYEEIVQYGSAICPHCEHLNIGSCRTNSKDAEWDDKCEHAYDFGYSTLTKKWFIEFTENDFTR